VELSQESIAGRFSSVTGFVLKYPIAGNQRSAEDLSTDHDPSYLFDRPAHLTWHDPLLFHPAVLHSAFLAIS
jgi:hypothetical protein